MVKTSIGSDPLLRRPFSVYRTHPDRKGPTPSRRQHLSLIYKRVGKGTLRMTELEAGQEVDLIGPLGNGFTLPPLPSSRRAILIGGGVGIVSLFPLVEALGKTPLLVFIGGQTREDLLCVDEFREKGADLWLATEDGSLGFRGTAIDLLRSRREVLGKDGLGALYACGPVGMLKALAKTVESTEVVCQVSLEARMGCGFGACWGCVVKTKGPERSYERVCKEGPVFNLKEIDWDEL